MVRSDAAGILKRQGHDEFAAFSGLLWARISPSMEADDFPAQA